MITPRSQTYWHNLIALHCALLDELSLHRRRTLILEAILALTGQPGHLWLVEEGEAHLEAAPPLLRQAAATQQRVDDPVERQQAIPLTHRQGGTLMGVLQGHFDQTPPEVVEALLIQVQLAFDEPLDQQLRRSILRQEEQLLAVSEISRAIVSELNLDQLLQKVANFLHERFGYRFIHIFVVHPARRLITFQAGFGPYASRLDREALTFSLDDETGIIAWVARNAQSALSNDVSEDSRFRPLNLPEVEIRAELTVPLIFGDQVLGVFDVESEERNAFTENDLWLLETLAPTIAIALRNAILYRSERWRRQAADSLRQIAGVVRTGETLDNLLVAILSQIANILPLTFAAIWLKNGAGYLCKAGYWLPKPPPSEPIQPAWFEQVIAATNPLIRRPEDPPLPLAESFPPDHSALGAVLQVDEHVLGVLVLAHRLPQRFGQEAAGLAEIFAGQAAIVIENTDLYHQAQEQAWVSTALLQVAEATRQLETLPDVLAAITRITPLISGVDACAIWLRNPTDLELAVIDYRIAALYGFPDDEVDRLQWLTLLPDHLLTLRLTLLKQPVVVTPAKARSDLPPEFASLPPRTRLFLPLLSQGDLNGMMMTLIDPQQANSEERLRLLTGIANQAAGAIQTAQLIEAQREEAYVSAAILQVAQAVVMQADLAEILETVVRVTPMLTGVDVCLILLYEAGQAILAAQDGLPDVALPLTISLQTLPELESVLTEGLPQVIDSQHPLPPGLQAIGLTAPLHGLIIPLGPKDNIVGALVVADRTERLTLVGKRRDIITGIAYQVALAVDNARLYAERARQQQLQRELELAREIQTAFILQQLPVLPGWEVATFWKMAREVGGDFFDLVVLPEDRLLVIIADVSDKGMPAALFMALTRSLFQATALELNQPPEILERVNRLLLPNNQKSMFVTVFCAIVQLRTGEVIYASAGHNNPILVRQSGQIESLHARGIVLGAFEDVFFEQKTVQLAEGDGILFYTDGITEASNPDDELFGEERLQAIVRDNWPQPPQTIVAAIQQAILDFTRPAPQFDDATLLLLKRTCSDQAEEKPETRFL